MSNRAAGADVAITASYQASFEGFARRGLDRDGTERLMHLSVRLAREAADAAGGARLVAASVGPYGATLADGSEYVGRYGLSVGELMAWHRPRLEALLAEEPDVLAVETIPAIEETEAVLTLLESYPGARAWIAFSCRDEEHISDGTPFNEAVAVASSSPQVVAVGINCTPPGSVPALLRHTRSVTTLPRVAYPNLGSSWDAETKAWRAEGPPPDFGAESARWRQEGAPIVGGCCGTTPEDIAAIAASN